MHSPLFGDFRVSGWGFGVGSWWRAPRMETWHATAKTLPHAHSSIWRLQGFGVELRGGVSGFRGGVSGWGRDAVRSAWKRGTIQQGHFHMHTPLFGDFRVSGRGFGVGFRGGVSRFRAGVSGWGRDAVRSAWKRGTPQQGHFHMHTPLFGDFRVSGWGFGVGSWGRAPRMETWHATAKTLPHAHSSICRLQGFGVGFRGGASGWGFGVGFRGSRTMPVAMNVKSTLQTNLFDNYASVHGMWNQHSKQTWIALEKTDCYPQLRSFSFFALKNIYSEMLQNSTTMPVSMECEINTQNKPGSPWRTLVAIHNFVASAFLHYKISTQKCFRPC